MTQAEQIAKYCKDHGSISPMEAFVFLKCTKLATRVSEMKYSGKYEIRQQFEKSKDGKKYMRYWIKEKGGNDVSMS